VKGRRSGSLLTAGWAGYGEIDINAASNVTVEVGDRVTGFVDADAALCRHAAAADAIKSAVRQTLFCRDQALMFDFFTYGDSIDELRDYIVENWRDARIHDDVAARTRDALRDTPGVRPRVHEHVAVTTLVRNTL
jgi:hypothetical protein